MNVCFRSSEWIGVLAGLVHHVNGCNDFLQPDSLLRSNFEGKCVFWDFFKCADDSVVPVHHFYYPAKGYLGGSGSRVASDDGNNFPCLRGLLLIIIIWSMCTPKGGVGRGGEGGGGTALLWPLTPSSPPWPSPVGHWAVAPRGVPLSACFNTSSAYLWPCWFLSSLVLLS